MADDTLATELKSTLEAATGITWYQDRAPDETTGVYGVFHIMLSGRAGAVYGELSSLLLDIYAYDDAAAAATALAAVHGALALRLFNTADGVSMRWQRELAEAVPEDDIRLTRMHAVYVGVWFSAQVATNMEVS